MKIFSSKERILSLKFSPGEYIQEELTARGWDQNYLADVTKLSYQVVNEIISGSHEMDTEIASKLSEAFGTSVDLWIGLEKDYQQRSINNE